jgi:hypothetical protein
MNKFCSFHILKLRRLKMTLDIHERAEGRTPPAKSASMELPIPGTNLSFIVSGVSCVNGKVTIASSLVETKIEKSVDGQLPRITTETKFEDVYTIALGPGPVSAHTHPDQG